MGQMTAFSLAFAVRDVFNTSSVTPYLLADTVFEIESIKELEYSPTLRTLYTNAANIVAINCYQYICAVTSGSRRQCEFLGAFERPCLKGGRFRYSAFPFKSRGFLT